MSSIQRQIAATTIAAILALGFTAASRAAVLTFNTDPFAGSTALTTPGRQIVGNELFVPVFDPATDVLAFDTGAFNFASPIGFFNGLAAGIPASGVNFVVLETFDGDNDPSNGVLLNAGLAANLIANAITDPGAGFFIYFNSGLDLPRLVYSTDLDSPLADLKVLARFTGLNGATGQQAMAQFNADGVAAVPEPATWAMLIAGFAMTGAALRSRRGAIFAA